MQFIVFAFIFLIEKLLAETECALFTLGDSPTFVLLESSGRDSLRVRIFPSRTNIRQNLPSAFSTSPICNPVEAFESYKQTSTFSNGDLLFNFDDSKRSMKFSNTKLKTDLLQMSLPVFNLVAVNHTSWYSTSVYHSIQDKEKIFGLGQHQSGILDSASHSQVFQFQPDNTEVFIPFFTSSLQYGLLFNVPSFGNLTISTSPQRKFVWSFDNVDHLDFWLTTNSDESFWKELMLNYVDATGHSPVWPYFTTGFWQSKNRYRNQTEILDVTDGFKLRELNLSIIVIDYYNWLPHPLGDETLSAPCWPNAKEMTSKLRSQNVQLMLSPYFHAVDPKSSNFDEAKNQRLLVLDTSGKIFTKGWQNSALYDVYQEDARTYLFEKVSDGLINDLEITLFWLDCDEPGGLPDQEKIDDLLWYNGGEWPSSAVGAAYPHLLDKALFDGLKRRNLPPVMLGRSAWAGTQRFGGGVWSGDIPSTFESLNQQFRAALNIQMSGITYWTTDIGGYGGGNINDPYFRELIVRWFQFGLFCPLFRIHGHRLPYEPAYGTCGNSGASNEIWNFGEESYNAIRKVMEIREALRPYIFKQYEENSKSGVPILRPLFFDFPQDNIALQVDDQAMFGPSYLIAPQLMQLNVTANRRLYLPQLSKGLWTDFFSGSSHKGGQWITVSTKLDEFPLFIRNI